MSELIRGRYEEIEVVGAGGQGRVVKALDHLHNRTVALKRRTLHGPDEREALLGEAGVLFRLPPSQHLPIVREDFFDGDDYVIVMDWVEGIDLSRILHTDGRPGLPPTLVLQWLADAAAALTHLHTQDPPVIHGDIKPANLVLTKGGRVSLVDFGASSTASTAGRRGGTPGYAAPERANLGISSRAADVYSLAATAFALLTGEPPTGVRPSWEGIDPTLAQQLEDAIRAGLATDPARRLATPGELVERMRAGWASSLPSGVLTFCFTDVVGSTTLWEDHPVAMSRALVMHDNIIAAAVERRGGRSISSMGEGDSTVSVFSSPLDAVAAAIDLTRDLAACAWPPELAVEVRTGLHTGEAEVRDGNYFGITLNAAARIRGLADARQIFLSSDTAELTRDHLPSDASLVDLGPARVRGRHDRMHVYALRAPGVDAPPPATECPYPGLLAFDAASSEHFHGRTAVTDEILHRLSVHPFIAVVGSSGSGKSSLLRAGIGARWPGGADVITPSSVERLTPEQLQPTDRVLIVDQLEELITQVTHHARRASFVSDLLAAERPVAVGLRADFYGSFATYRDLAAELASHQVLLGSMTIGELREAIEEPARRAGLRIEPGLVDLLIAEVEGEPGVLPLLAHALRTTWEQRDGRTLTIDAYRATGGLRGAIATTADETMATLDDTDRAIAKQVLLRLVELGDGPDDTRRRASLAELRPATDIDGRADRVVEALAARRLISVDAENVEVAHEALIREWPQLRSWLAEQRDDLRIQRQVTAAADAWDAQGRHPTELFRGPRLAAAVEWLERQAHASVLEADYVAASVEEEERVREAQVRTNRRLRTSLIAVGVALALAVVGGAVALGQRLDATNARDQAEVARLAALSRSLVERQPDVGMLLAVEASQRGDTPETRSTLLSALEAHPLLEGLIYGSDTGLESGVFTPDGTLLATPASDGSGTALWDVATRERVGALDHENDAVLNADISPDGKTLVASVVSYDDDTPASHLQVWDVERQQLLERIESPAGGLNSVAYSADGRTVITQGGPFFDRPPQLTAVLWDAATWSSESWTLSQDYLADDIIAVSDDGHVLAFPEGDGVDVYDVRTRELLTHVTLDGLTTALALDGDGSLLVVGEESGAVHGVDTQTAQRTFESVPLGDVPASVMEINPDETTLAIGTELGTIQLIDLSTGALLGPPLAASSARISDVSFSLEGRRLATTALDRTGAIWRLDGDRSIGDAIHDHESAVTAVDTTPDGRYLVSGSTDGTVSVRDTRDGSATQIDADGEVLSVDVDPSGERLALGTSTGQVRVLSLPDLDAVASTSVGQVAVEAVAFQPSTETLAVATYDHEALAEPFGHLVLWDPATGEEITRRISAPGGSPFALAWSPDGDIIAASFDNHVLRLYDSRARYEQVGDDIVIEDDLTTTIAFSPDGTRLATGSGSGVVRQYDTATHDTIGPALRGHSFWIGGVAYSNDGSVLAATTLGLSTTRLWTASTGAPIGDELVAGATPFTLRRLDLERPYHSQPSFTPDGQSLYTPSFDGSVVRWDLDPATWVQAACSIVGRSLTEAEWRQHMGDIAYRETCADS